jgi:hypothetical protein
MTLRWVAVKQRWIELIEATRPVLVRPTLR